ncbi:unnamed protein product [Orchesella dallaii]|uniref:Uncharacterized protein n=1 Tax=Orchesella dallaii TaxID=48710 RepID=A0ABP1QNI4_9HEXA
MKLYILLALGFVPAFVCGDVCEVGGTDCIKCLSIKGCSFFVTEEKASCHQLNEKLGKLRFKATKKSQCKTVHVLLEKKATTDSINSHENSSSSTNFTINIKQQQSLHEERAMIDSARSNEEKVNVAILQTPNVNTNIASISTSTDGTVQIPTVSVRRSIYQQQIFHQMERKEDETRDTVIPTVAVRRSIYQQHEKEVAPNSDDAAIIVPPSPNLNDHVPAETTPDLIDPVTMKSNEVQHPIQTGDAPTINGEESTETFVQLFNYHEHQLDSFFYDCSKENRLLKRVENSLCTSFRLLERTRKKQWIINARVTGVQYNETVCSFLKAEKLYCKTML